MVEAVRPADDPEVVFLRVISGTRSRRRFVEALGYQPDYHFVFQQDGDLVPVPRERVEELRRIKGVSVARLKGQRPLRCWRSSRLEEERRL
jgi:hypothetical protein